MTTVDEIRELARLDNPHNQALYSSQAVAALLAEIDRLTAERDGAHRDLDELEEWIDDTLDEDEPDPDASHGERLRDAMDARDATIRGLTAELAALRKVREAAERTVDAHDKQHARMSGAGVLDAAVSALRSALTAARGEGGSHE
jgi:uncharacterized coiled-coil DUF342 family protein